MVKIRGIIKYFLALLSSNCPYVAQGGFFKLVLCVRLVFRCIAILTSPQIYMAMDRANEQTAKDN
jgi:hypothetical protein